GFEAPRLQSRADRPAQPRLQTPLPQGPEARRGHRRAVRARRRGGRGCPPGGLSSGIHPGHRPVGAMPAPSTHSVRIGIVTGEASGDQLGAGLMAALREHFPDALFEGIGGERMIAAGFHSLHPQERLAVMGVVEPLKRLPELLRIRGALYRHFAASGADLVVGIDSPDFNLGLELKLRRRGLLTAHYVSPSVW